MTRIWGQFGAFLGRIFGATWGAWGACRGCEWVDNGLTDHFITRSGMKRKNNKNDVRRGGGPEKKDKKRRGVSRCHI